MIVEVVGDQMETKTGDVPIVIALLVQLLVDVLAVAVAALLPDDQEMKSEEVIEIAVIEVTEEIGEIVIVVIAVIATVVTVMIESAATEVTVIATAGIKHTSKVGSEDDILNCSMY